ncbi:helix-turn-helix domain-containing protein [Enterococcus wangshanyuanii]|uniref:HTH cro/C1-type domain-containing protein n=1 Tax=Enterococcus wangshanyuanii TaxID=2005703 RepID=A0ABQ1NT45_9ENTE|nr:helix-turn-helix domain-containing protein [Enterococcus wangshanyuanii]GGC84605.1 hypothetical protein GCM10011573_12770 [Enterococcus wangshanyuanii]
MNERIYQLRKKLGYNQEKFGTLIGVTKSAISNWESGRRKIPDSSIKLICRQFNVDYIWLTTGEGEMFHQSDDEIEVAVEKIMYGENEFHKNLFKTFLKLGEEELLALEKIMDTYDEIVKNDKEKS